MIVSHPLFNIIGILYYNDFQAIKSMIKLQVKTFACYAEFKYISALLSIDHCSKKTLY